MEEYKRPLGDTVKRAREKRQITQSELSERIGKSDRTILNIENYDSNPTMDVLYPLVRTLKIDPRLIYYPEEEQTQPNKQTLRFLIDDCDKEVAGTLIPIVESVIAFAKSRPKIDV